MPFFVFTPCAGPTAPTVAKNTSAQPPRATASSGASHLAAPHQTRKLPSAGFVPIIGTIVAWGVDDGSAGDRTHERAFRAHSRAQYQRQPAADGAAASRPAEHDGRYQGQHHHYRIVDRADA